MPIRRLLIAAVLLAVLATLAVYHKAILTRLGLTPPPSADAAAWAELGQITAALQAKLHPSTLLLTTSVHDATQLTAHIPNNPTVLAQNQTSEWANLKSRLVLYINLVDDTVPPAIQSKFKECQPYAKAAAERPEGADPLRASYHLCWNP